MGRRLDREDWKGQATVVHHGNERFEVAIAEVPDGAWKLKQVVPQRTSFVTDPLSIELTHAIADEARWDDITNVQWKTRKNAEDVIGRALNKLSDRKNWYWNRQWRRTA